MSNRSYPVPARVSATVEGDGPLARRVRDGEALSTDDLYRAVVIAAGTPLGNWADQIISNEQAAMLDAFLPDDRLPLGVLASGNDDDDIVVALSLGDQIFTASGWSEGTVEDRYLIELDEGTIVAVADALSSGADGLVLRPWIPLAFLAAAPAPAATAKPKTPPRPGRALPGKPEAGGKPAAAPTAAQAAEKPEPDKPDAAAEGAPNDGLPPDAKVVAVVDDLDKTAVIELLAIAPGPKVFRRNDGTWTEDPKWVQNLRSVTPPPLVQLADPKQIGDVVAQVDESTKGMPFEPKQKEEAPAPEAAPAPAPAPAEKKPPVAASADWSTEHQRRADDFATRLALVAASKAAASAKGHAVGAEKLRQYWLHGKGALKIRWGTPGDWKRCFRHLAKYMGPRAAGYCQNMHKKATGVYTGSKLNP
jgi:hypothetical protein